MPEEVDARRMLRAELGSAPPKGLDALSEEDLGRLATALRDARHRQSRALNVALLSALDHVPRLLRAPVRKIVGG